MPRHVEMRPSNDPAPSVRPPCFSAYAMQSFDKLFIPKRSFPPLEHTRLHPCVDRWILTRHTPLLSNKMMILRKGSLSHQECRTMEPSAHDLDILPRSRSRPAIPCGPSSRNQALPSINNRNAGTVNATLIRSEPSDLRGRRI